MKRAATILLISSIRVSSVFGVTSPEMEHIAMLNKTLEDKGLKVFLATARQKRWSAPTIPSKWHVAHVATPAVNPRLTMAREFGRTLAGRIEVPVKSTVTLPLGDDLFAEVSFLCDLAEWCASTEGYGNLLLARECLRAAALGTMRLATGTEFQMERLEHVQARLHVHWMEPESRARILNAEAGAALFTDTTQEGLDRLWMSGGVLMRDERYPTRQQKDNSKETRERLVITDDIKNNLAFFEDDKPSEETTLQASWDDKNHNLFVAGVNLRAIVEADALIAFRKRIGFFPIADNPASPYRGAKGAFDEAWRATVVRKATMSHSEWNRELGIGLVAWRAYDMVQRTTPQKVPPTPEVPGSRRVAP